MVVVNEKGGGSVPLTGREPPPQSSEQTSSEISLLLAVQYLLEMHREQVEMLGLLLQQNQTIIDQNQQMLEALNMAVDDDNDEPRAYLDGTPVN